MNLFFKVWRYIKHLSQAFIRAGRRIKKDEVLVRASSLAFSSMFAMIPTAAISLGIFSNFVSFQPEIAAIKKLIIKTFLPGIGDALESHINEFIVNASSLSVTGIAALIISSALLIYEIHSTFNKLFNSFGESSLRERLLEFWALITGLPFAVLSIVPIGSSFLVKYGIGSGSILDSLQSYLIPWCAFVIVLIMFSPKKTAFSATLVGASVGSLFYVIAQFVFIEYISLPIIPNLLYGALSVIPLLQLWLLIVWTIIIFSAIFTAELIKDQRRS